MKMNRIQVRQLILAVLEQFNYDMYEDYAFLDVGDASWEADMQDGITEIIPKINKILAKEKIKLPAKKKKKVR